MNWNRFGFNCALLITPNIITQVTSYWKQRFQYLSNFTELKTVLQILRYIIVNISDIESGLQNMGFDLCDPSKSIYIEKDWNQFELKFHVNLGLTVHVKIHIYYSLVSEIYLDLGIEHFSLVRRDPLYLLSNIIWENQDYNLHYIYCLICTYPTPQCTIHTISHIPNTYNRDQTRISTWISVG